MDDNKPVKSAADPKAPAAVAAPAPETRIDKIEDAIEQWFADHFRNSVVSRAGSEVWNLVHAAKQDLKERLKSL